MVIKVAAGIICQDDAFFIALRKKEQHQGGLWEFPGGKCDDGESPDTTLVRELKEECGITATEYYPFKLISHDYGDKQVELHFYKVIAFEGIAEGQEGQETRWVTASDLHLYAFPEANQAIVSALLNVD
ncbi:8-oxo-dGTP diphosphatase MutT [Marinomonas algarum]|uniref:8-oxo-dGTP diphosphatase n=1 Tax=Marinomonas algarum TaxID=2883105 RepID=A0A9X1IPA2_9GAMM|nr:8-oxo-dGTP diphosphatase MutT [Marinomonas algarum]MCB5161423.1 8-oxo-dGTP diphosphatase MutT [Marinomonas algarum]